MTEQNIDKRHEMDMPYANPKQKLPHHIPRARVKACIGTNKAGSYAQRKEVRQTLGYRLQKMVVLGVPSRFAFSWNMS